jgi:hypothetical protein
LARIDYGFYSSLAQIFNAYSYTDFDNHSNGYNRSRIALLWSGSRLPEIRFFNGFKLEFKFGIDENCDF